MYRQTVQLLFFYSTIQMRLITLIFFFLIVFNNSFAGIVVLNGLTHIHDAARGTTISGKIKVQNNGKKEAKFLIYQEDLAFPCDKNTVEKDSVNARSLTKWLRTNVEEKTLQSNEVYDITYSFTIPQDLKQDGSYWSAIMIEGIDPIKENLEGGVKIDTKVRYAIQVITNVGVIQSSKMTFENIGFLQKDSTTQSLNVKLKNNGIFLSKTKLSLEIYDDSGKKLKTIESTSKKMYPEKCNDFEIFIKDLPKGTYNGVVIADNGKELYGANVSLEIN